MNYRLSEPCNMRLVKSHRIMRTIFARPSTLFFTNLSLILVHRNRCDSMNYQMMWTPMSLSLLECILNLRSWEKGVLYIYVISTCTLTHFKGPILLERPYTWQEVISIQSHLRSWIHSHHLRYMIVG